jgi:hypothetical protein
MEDLMLQRLRNWQSFARSAHADSREVRSTTGFTALRLFSAELFLSTGANATLHYLRTRSEAPQSQQFDDSPGQPQPAPHQRLPSALTWAPLLLGSIACAVHATRAFRPADVPERAGRPLNFGVLGLGAVGVADTLAGAIRGEQPFSVTPLLFAYAGLFGLLLDREEDRVADQKAELERRARIVERLVPRRRPKLERIVVHV